MLEAVVAPMTDSELSLPRPQAGRSFRRSITAHPAISGEKEQVSFVSSARMLDGENPVLQSMCKLLTSLLRLPTAGVLPCCRESPAHDRHDRHLAISQHQQARSMHVPSMAGCLHCCPGCPQQGYACQQGSQALPQGHVMSACS